MTEHAMVIRGGRVIDPAQGLDAVSDVGIQDGRVTAVGSGLRRAAMRHWARRLPCIASAAPDSCQASSRS